MSVNEDTVSVVILMDMLLVTSEKEHIYSYIDIVVWGEKEAGKIILDFALPNDLTVINTFFRIKKSII